MASEKTREEIRIAVESESQAKASAFNKIIVLLNNFIKGPIPDQQREICNVLLKNSDDFFNESLQELQLPMRSDITLNSIHLLTFTRWIIDVYHDLESLEEISDIGIEKDGTIVLYITGEYDNDAAELDDDYQEPERTEKWNPYSI